MFLVSKKDEKKDLAPADTMDIFEILDQVNYKIKHKGISFNVSGTHNKCEIRLKEPNKQSVVVCSGDISTAINFLCGAQYGIYCLAP